jgi:GntR family transcriptional regulator, rspAB operon transcriptional repressor
MKWTSDKPSALTLKGTGNATERVLAAVREAIVDLELPPGTLIDKGALCSRFGVSRFPVSDALTRLQAEGLVEVLPQRGTRVARIRMSDVTQAMFIRRALEEEMVRTLAPNASDAFIAELEMNIGYQQVTVERGDPRAFHHLDLAFHELMLRELGFPRVTVAIDTARSSLERARRMLSSPRRHADTLLEHRAILEALKARDGAAAAVAMDNHLNAVLTELTTFMAVNPAVFESSE